MRNHLLFLVLLVSVFCGGCTSGNTISGSAPLTIDETQPDPDPVVARPSADVLVVHLLNRALPAQIVSLRFTARDSQGNVVFSTAARPRQSEIRLSPVPVEASELLIEYLDDQLQLLGVFQARLTLVEGQTYVVEDPGFRDVTEAVTGLDVTPESSSLARGTFQQLIATATLQDGTQVNVSSQVDWSSSDEATATVSSLGLVAGLNPGNLSVTASLASFSDQADLTVTNANLQNLVVSPPTGTVAAGTSQQFTALGFFSDGSFQDLTAFATWTASGQANVSAQGLATGTSQGSAQIGAAFSGQSNAATLTVNGATLVSIDLTPNGAVLTPGAVQPFTATGNLSDGSSQNLTGSVIWSSTGNLAANVYTASATGNFTVTATQGAVSRTVDVQVAPPAGFGPLLFTAHNRTMFRLKAFSQTGTGEIAPLYIQDSLFLPGSAGSLTQLVANPASRTALVLNRLANNSNAGSRLAVNPDGSSSNSGLYTTIGPNLMAAEWGPDGRILVQAAQITSLALASYGPDGTMLGSSLPQNLAAPITGLAMVASGRFTHACTASNLFTVPINNPNVLGAPTMLAQTGLNFLEAGPQARALYGIAFSANIRVYNLNLTTGAPTISTTTPLPGARELLLSPDQRFLFALTNGPDQVWVYPVNQATLGLGAPVGPFPAGLTPSGLTTDPGGSFLYLASSGDNSVVAYAINKVSGQLTPVNGSPFATGETGLSDVMMLP